MNCSDTEGGTPGNQKAEILSVSSEEFADLHIGAEIIRVDPCQCIPLTRVRKLSPSGVRRLEHSFDGGESEGNIFSGISSAGAKPTVVRLVGALHKYVKEYFLSIGMSTTEAQEKIGTFSEWYGIIDGAHRRQAILNLINRKPERWSGFQWTVERVEARDVHILRAYARSCNEKQEERNVVETTQYDMLRSMKDDANLLLSELNGKPPGRGFINKVASYYVGGKAKVTNTVRQLAGTAVKLSEEVIETIGEILNSEHPEMAKSLCSTVGKTAKSSSSERDEFVDCRIYRLIISSHTIKGASEFKEAEQPDQVNALFRIQYISSSRFYRPTAPKILNEQTTAARRARQEVEKFESLMESKVWPESMAVCRLNLLRTTKLDSEVQTYHGNDSNCLPVLLNLFKKSCPAQYEWKLKKFSSNICMNAETLPLDIRQREVVSPPVNDVESHEVSAESADGGPDATIHGSEAPHENVVNQSRNGKQAVSNHENDNSHTGTAFSNRISGDHDSSGPDQRSVLQKASIKCHQMSWKDYEKTVHKDGENFNLILCDPPYNLPKNKSKTGKHYRDFIDDDHISSFAQFCRRMVVPGGYVFLFTSFHLFHKWVFAFEKCQMSVMQHPFVLVKISSEMQGYRYSDTPQNACELAVLARVPGAARNSFKPDFLSPYCFIQCSHKRRFSIIDNIPVTKNKLTFPGSREIVRVEEKNPSLLSAIITTLCPEDGNVLDPFAGTMTTGIACLASTRSCTMVEQDISCFRLALGRLGHIAEENIRRKNIQRPRRSMNLANERAGILNIYNEGKDSSTSLSDQVVETPTKRRKVFDQDTPMKHDQRPETVPDSDFPEVDLGETECEVNNDMTKDLKGVVSSGTDGIFVVCAAGNKCKLKNDRDAQVAEKMTRKCPECRKFVHDLCSGGETTVRFCLQCRAAQLDERFQEL